VQVRRVLLLFALVLGLSAVVASLAPPPEKPGDEDRGTDTSVTTSPQSTGPAMRRMPIRIVARGEEQLQTQRGQVVRELRQEIGTLAVELSEKIVGEQLADDARVSATVDSFIADLERQDAAEQAR